MKDTAQRGGGRDTKERWNLGGWVHVLMEVVLLFVGLRVVVLVLRKMAEVGTEASERVLSAVLEIHQVAVMLVTVLMLVIIPVAVAVRIHVKTYHAVEFVHTCAYLLLMVWIPFSSHSFPCHCQQSKCGQAEGKRAH